MIPVRQQTRIATESERTGWYGWIAFAGIMMIVLGIFHAIMGLVGLFQEDYFPSESSG